MFNQTSSFSSTIKIPWTTPLHLNPSIHRRSPPTTTPWLPKFYRNLQIPASWRKNWRRKRRIKNASRTLLTLNLPLPAIHRHLVLRRRFHNLLKGVLGFPPVVGTLESSLAPVDRKATMLKPLHFLSACLLLLFLLRFFFFFKNNLRIEMLFLFTFCFYISPVGRVAQVMVRRGGGGWKILHLLGCKISLLCESFVIVELGYWLLAGNICIC